MPTPQAAPKHSHAHVHTCPQTHARISQLRARLWGLAEAQLFPLVFTGQLSAPTR